LTNVTEPEIIIQVIQLLEECLHDFDCEGMFLGQYYGMGLLKLKVNLFNSSAVRRRVNLRLRKIKL
jgi:hypothetical protein